MNLASVFNPRDFCFKKPFGAVACGESLSLTCRPLARDAFTHCAILFSGEFSKREWEVELPFSGLWEDRACGKLTAQCFLLSYLSS